MIKRTERESTGTWTERYTKESGAKTNSMAKEKNLGRTLRCTKATTLTARSTGKADSLGLITRATRASLSTTTSAGMAFTNGQITDATGDTGEITRCMATESLIGLTEGSTRATMLRTGKKEKGS